MLRMGRGSKPEPTENERAAQQPPAYHTPERAHVPQPHAETTTRVAQQQQHAAPSSTTTRAVTEAESLAREIKEGTMSGFVGSGTVLTGEVVFKGMLRVDGHLLGNVRSEKGTLIVSSGGRVDAGIEVAVARVNGTVNGDITATERIEFGRTARVNGNISTPALAIEQGALFEGVCHMRRPEPERASRRELVSAAEAAVSAVESRSQVGPRAGVEARDANAETDAHDEGSMNGDGGAGASRNARPATTNVAARNASTLPRRTDAATAARDRVG